MDIARHRQEFERIGLKYGLRSEEKAGEIADFLTKNHGHALSAKEFAKLFNMELDDAVVFLTFVERAIKFKEKHIDPAANAQVT